MLTPTTNLPDDLMASGTVLAISSTFSAGAALDVELPPPLPPESPPLAQPDNVRAPVAANTATARQIFNRFRQAVEHHVFPQVGRVTVSVGFVSTHEGSAVEILGHADQALYYAKEHGRNQVCHYDELIGSGRLKKQTQAHDEVELF